MQPSSVSVSRACCALTLLLVVSVHARRARAFDYFEHRWIGDVACGLLAGDAASCVLWEDAPGGIGTITFGDLTALVGDHYWTPRELADALVEITHDRRDRPACGDPSTPAVRKLCTTLAYRELELAYVRTWYADGARSLNADIEACDPLAPWLAVWGAEHLPPRHEAPGCHVELEASVPDAADPIPVRVAGDCFAPPDHLIARLRALPDRIALAASDDSHFGAAALAMWRQHHRAAKEAKARGDEMLALASEAFALHFLSDLYAAGHIRNPRGSVHHDLADAMRYHDQDNATGLLVELSPGGARWYAYGDRCLFGARAHANRAMVVRASLASLSDLSDLSDRADRADRADPNPPRPFEPVQVESPAMAPWDFEPPRVSAFDTTPSPSHNGTAPLTLSLYTGAGMMAGPAKGPPVGMELVLAHDWQLTTWWNPLLDLRHGVSFWADGTVMIEIASAPLLELLTLPAVPFVAIASVEAADSLRRVGKGIDPVTRLSIGPFNLQLDADLGLSLVRSRSSDPFDLHLLGRAGVFLEVPDRWRLYAPRVTVLMPIGGDPGSPWRATFTVGLEHAF